MELLKTLLISITLLAIAAAVFLVGQQSNITWKKQIANEAIDGCAAYSQYSTTKSTTNDAGQTTTVTESFPIGWLFDECMENKQLTYTKSR